MRDPFGLFNERDGRGAPRERKAKPLEAKALETLGLDAKATGEDIKARYKELVKRTIPMRMAATGVRKTVSAMCFRPIACSSRRVCAEQPRSCHFQLSSAGKGFKTAPEEIRLPAS